MLSLLALLLASTPPPTHPTVVIDAGHGGIREGATGICGLKEKDVTLAVAHELAQLLAASGKARPLLTRKVDVDISLDERAAVANKAGAALFVSIHANASTLTDARGVETYFLSHGAADKRDHLLVLRENDGRLLAEAHQDNALAKVLASLQLEAAHAESQRLAIAIQDLLQGHLQTRGRGVLQAPFIVLKETSMAAVLVEIGFLTNMEECKELASVEHQRRIARTLATAVLQHLSNNAALYARK